MSYYKSELKKIKLSEYPTSFQIFGGEGENTKQMNLTLESIKELRKFLSYNEKIIKLKKGFRK
jgi:hypothetical protein